MFPNRLVFLGLLLSVVGVFSVEALSSEEKELLKTPREAAAKTFAQDSLHETVSIETNDITEGITVETTGDRVQQKNTVGGRDVYATLTTIGKWFGFPIARFTMDELVFKDVAWARLIDGEYFDDLPTGWFKPGEYGLDDLQMAVENRYYMATGELVTPFLLDGFVSSITEVGDSRPETECFKVTPTEYVSAGDAEQRTFCVKGGLLVSYDYYLEYTEFDEESGYDITYIDSLSIAYSKFGEPVKIPDPTQPSNLKRLFKRVGMAGTSVGSVKLRSDA